MTPADLRQNPQAVEEPRSSLHALLELPSCIYAPSRAEEPEKLAKIALSSETWAKRMAQLPALQKKVLAMYYYENMQLAEIAKVFGLTESRICQIRGDAVEVLRKYLTKLLA